MPDAYDFWADRLPPGDAAAVGRFWDAFLRIADELDRAFTTGDGDLDPTAATIEAIGDLHDRGIFWEYGPGERGHSLALSPELNHEARPLARALVRAAPDLPRWTFTDARTPMAPSAQTVELIERRANMPFAISGITPSAGEHHRIDFLGTGDGSAETVGGMAALAFSVLFGEAMERDWLGEARGSGRGALSRLRRRPDPMEWLPAFVETTREVLDDLLNGRPDCPRATAFAETAEFTLLRLTPRGAEPGADRITYSTPHADLASAMFAGARVSAPRFTRFGESFCGLVVERTEAHPFGQVDDRAALTVAIHRALAGDGTGGVTGEGHGTGHVYIDIAVTDIPLAIAIVERETGRAGLTGPAWFTFHEAGLEERRVPLTPAARHN